MPLFQRLKFPKVKRQSWSNFFAAALVINSRFQFSVDISRLKLAAAETLIERKGERIRTKTKLIWIAFVCDQSRTKPKMVAVLVKKHDDNDWNGFWTEILKHNNAGNSRLKVLLSQFMKITKRT